MLNQEKLLNTQLMKLINDELKKNPTITKFSFNTEHETEEAFDLLEQVKKEIGITDNSLKLTLSMDMAEKAHKAIQ